MIFVGKKFSEPTLLSYAYAFTRARDYPGRLINRDLETTPGPVAP